MDAPNYATLPAADRMAAYLSWTGRKRPLDTKTKHRVAEVEVIDANHPLWKPYRPSPIEMQGPFCCDRCGAVNGCNCPVSAPPECGDDDLRFSTARP